MRTGEKLRYMGTAFAVSFLFPLPLLPYLLMDNGLMIGLARLAFSLLTVPGVLALCVILPLVCGWFLAARAHFPPTFSAKFLPLLLPPCVYLFLLSRHLRVPNHTACHFAEKTRFFRSLSAGRRCAAASHFAFFKGNMLYQEEDISL